MTLSSRDVCAPFNSRCALDPDSPAPPPLPKHKAPVKRSAALLVQCPECRVVQGSWCRPDRRAKDREANPWGPRALHQARLDLVAGEVTKKFDRSKALKARGA